MTEKAATFKKVMVGAYCAAVACVVLGLLGTVAGIVRAFKTLEQAGGADPAELAGSIGGAQLTTLGGWIIGFISLAVGIVFHIRYARERSLENPA
ncbi:MAG: MotA/TolQ/ExbB proton channel family protein [Verrucomicrobiales bacterium]|nr:MotA/TolQ/ExbB proton channel family protein [Verrucomicrobiales bacterium]